MRLLDKQLIVLAGKFEKGFPNTDQLIWEELSQASQNQVCLNSTVSKCFRRQPEVMLPKTKMESLADKLLKRTFISGRSPLVRPA